MLNGLSILSDEFPTALNEFPNEIMSNELFLNKIPITLNEFVITLDELPLNKKPNMLNPITLNKFQLR